MQLINKQEIAERIAAMQGVDLYLHLEVTPGAYASHFDTSKHPSAMFISNAQINYSHGAVSGEGPYRVGLKLEHGWVYCEGLTHVDETETERLVMAGHESGGKLVVAMQLSKQPF